ncbi:hypothetical protein LJC01_00775 [Clostridiaceae bacterium OttesenSCG-928-D20]|nr:hypothetical protein [Clostridiaceae bacterium OttesenSCG-928-D20]
MKTLSIGVAGTAKNTGKTTTLLALIDCARADGFKKIGLTSIGYDGEYRDNVTGLAKPRVFVREGDIVAVSEGCIKLSEAELLPLERLDIQTPLGKIAVCSVRREGLLLVAGPSRKKELKTVIERLKAYGAELIFVDGALSRIVPMSETDGLVLATGAALTTNFESLCQNSAAILDVLSCGLSGADENILRLGSVFDADDLLKLMAALRENESVQIDGIIALEQLVSLSEQELNIGKKTLIFSDPTSLLVSGDSILLSRTIKELSKQKIAVKTRRALKPLALTVNPYHPKYLPESQSYEAAYVDKIELIKSVRKAIKNTPSADIIAEGARDLWSEIMRVL